MTVPSLTWGPAGPHRTRSGAGWAGAFGGCGAVVGEFWRLMVTNDFGSVAVALAEDLVVEWPQSGERFRGPGAFVRMNLE